MKKCSPFLTVLLLSLFFLNVLDAQPFLLRDTAPDSPAFQRRFLASYGVNEAIEPPLTQKDQSLYKRIAPLLRDNPRAAIQQVEWQLTPSSNAALHFLLGNLYYSIDNPSQAKIQLNKTIEKFPNFRRAYRTLGLIAIQQSAMNEAISYWQKVITLGGGDAQSYGLLAYAYLTKEKYYSALSAYRMARMFNPESNDYKRGEAHCLLMTRQSAEAIALFDELITASPKTKDYWLLQANAFLNIDEPRQAMTNLEIIRDAGQADFESLMLLGRLYFNDYIYTQGLAVCLEALSQSNNVSFERAIQPLHFLIKRDLIEEANQYFKAFEVRVQNGLTQEQEMELLLAAVSLDFANGRDDSALEKSKRILAQDPLNGRCLILFGRYYQKQKKEEEAVFYLERATSVPAFESEALIDLGRLAINQSDFRRALTFFKKAQSINPSENLKKYIDQIEQVSRIF